jgi:hypothetical protein
MFALGSVGIQLHCIHWMFPKLHFRCRICSHCSISSAICVFFCMFHVSESIIWTVSSGQMQYENWTVYKPSVLLLHLPGTTLLKTESIRGWDSNKGNIRLGRGGHFLAHLV